MTRDEELAEIESFKQKKGITVCPIADPNSISLVGYYEAKEKKRRGRPKGSTKKTIRNEVSNIYGFSDPE